MNVMFFLLHPFTKYNWMCLVSPSPHRAKSHKENELMQLSSSSTTIQRETVSITTFRVMGVSELELLIRFLMQKSD